MNTHDAAQPTKTATSSSFSAPGHLLQRKCACGGRAITSGECEACARKKGSLQRKSVNENAVAEVPQIVHEVLRSPGQPLDPATRTFMEPRFGHDFSAVRVHTDAEAAESARAVNALAYTVGRNVVFGYNQYAPQTATGRHLLAHEFTHTIQQSSGLPSESRPHIEDASSAAEQEAAENANVVMNGGNPHVMQREIGLARQTPAPAPGVQPPSPPPPAPSQQSTLAQELQALIDGATWKEIRKRAYPKESSAGVKRAKERHAGTRPDLTGLGRLKTLDHFAQKVRTIQTSWPSLSTPDKRVKEIGAAANVELAGAEVPAFLVVDKERMEPKGYFQPTQWKFAINDALVSGKSLGPADAGELANTTLHECRHAEQHFLAARFSAGTNKDAAAIAAEQSVPEVIADEAVKKKFDAKTDPTAAALGKRMYQANVTDAAQNQMINDAVDVALATMTQKRRQATSALAKLKSGATAATIAEATAKRDELKAQIVVVEQKYAGYRNIPYEADAHEVGDAAEQAFEGWP